MAGISTTDSLGTFSDVLLMDIKAALDCVDKRLLGVNSETKVHFISREREKLLKLVTTKRKELSFWSSSPAVKGHALYKDVEKKSKSLLDKLRRQLPTITGDSSVTGMVKSQIEFVQKTVGTTKYSTDMEMLKANAPSSGGILPLLLFIIVLLEVGKDWLNKEK